MNTWLRIAITVLEGLIAAGTGCTGCSLGSSMPVTAPQQTADVSPQQTQTPTMTQTANPVTTVQVGTVPPATAPQASP